MNPGLITILLHCALILAALAGSAYFSAAEMALISTNRIRLRQRARSGQPRARRAVRLLERREHLLIMFLVGQSGFNVFAAAVATGLVDRAGGAGWVAPLISTLGMTIVIVVAAEIVPKVIGKSRAGRLLMRDSRGLELLHHLFLPLTGIAHFYVLGLLRLMGRGRRDPFVTREELRVLVREAESDDESGRREKRMLESILDFRDTVAREVMIPMNRVIGIERGATCDVWRTLVRRHGYTRIPVYEKQRDRVVGVLNIFDLLYDPEPNELVDAYLRPAPIVPDSKRVDHLLVEMQKARNPMVVIVDEFGACQGIVTVEDIVEEIVGELADEHERAYHKIRRLSPRVYIVEALTDIDDINQELGLHLPKRRCDTVGGLILKRAGRIPRVGESFSLHGLTFAILDAYPYGVRSVKITLPPEEGA
ncbi:MAG: HlyC/CorC family transporter [Candidatus Eisenbacteria sp.]|nr:HlyC/CorC family transporter [Candidatus Eisenbacteria bacterium]